MAANTITSAAEVTNQTCQVAVSSYRPTVILDSSSVPVGATDGAVGPQRRRNHITLQRSLGDCVSHGRMNRRFLALFR